MGDQSSEQVRLLPSPLLISGEWANAIVNSLLCNALYDLLKGAMITDIPYKGFDVIVCLDAIYGGEEPRLG